MLGGPTFTMEVLAEMLGVHEENGIGKITKLHISFFLLVFFWK